MNIIVCIKRVPETADADVIIDKSGKDIEKSGLVYDLNEWDSYAIEEAILLSDRILVLRQGRLVGEFSRAEADQHNVGSAMMSDQVMVADTPAPTPVAGGAA